MFNHQAVGIWFVYKARFISFVLVEYLPENQHLSHPGERMEQEDHVQMWFERGYGDR